MKRSTLIWTILLLLGGGFLLYRTSTGAMGRVYVRTVEVQPENSDKTWTKEIVAFPKEREEPEVSFSWSRTIGLWIAALCSLAILSFLYGDNPLYKLAESVFVGASAGYAMAVGFWSGIVELLLQSLTPSLMRASFLPGIKESQEPNLIMLIPLMLGVMFLWRLAPAGGWISRWPLAFFIGITAGMRLVAYFEADFVAQVNSTIFPLIIMAADGSVDYASSVKNMTILVGVLACLVYFFFSIEHKGVVGGIARLGIWFLMITFGAGFGYTVMGRIALLAERLEFLYDDWLWLIDPLEKRLGM